MQFIFSSGILATLYSLCSLAIVQTVRFFCIISSSRSLSPASHASYQASSQSHTSGLSVHRTFYNYAKNVYNYAKQNPLSRCIYRLYHQFGKKLFWIKFIQNTTIKLKILHKKRANVIAHSTFYKNIYHFFRYLCNSELHELNFFLSDQRSNSKMIIKLKWV